MPEQAKTQRKKKRRWLWLPAGLLLLCLATVGILALSNRSLPTQSDVVTQLSEGDKAHLAEMFHLRRTLGHTLWPGWGEAEIPAIVYNEEYAFLVNYPEPPPPAGWRKVPDNQQRGGPWEPVPDDTFQGNPYYRQRLEDGITPQAFTVRIGDQWVSSMNTKQWMQISLINEFKNGLPGFLTPIFPYRLASDLFLGNSDKFVSLLLHESFHAYQGIQAPDHLIAGERAQRLNADRYPAAEEDAVDAWQAELDLLADAVATEDAATMTDMAQEFLTQRARRRETLGLDQRLIAYEQQREWVEGLAKYTEMSIWREAGTSPDYEPVAAIQDDGDFDGYDNWDTAWKREVDQIRRMAGNDGDGRFYYSGWAQAVLLDRLMPDWHTRILAPDATLEGLLAAAVAEAAGDAADAATADTQTVTVYFGNSQRAEDGACDQVFPVTRPAPAGADPARAALETLFAGPTPAEQDAGYHSSFSATTGDILRGLKIDGSTAYVNLADIRDTMPGASSSCGSQAFRAQVERTLRATVPRVTRIIYAIEGDPRPFYQWMQLGCSPDTGNCDPTPFADISS